MTKSISVILFGAGGVGLALLRQLVNGRSRIAERAGCRFEVVAVADSRSWLFAPQGLPDADLLALIARKEAGDRVSAGEERPSSLEIINQVAEAGIAQAIVVDVTAVSGMESALDRAIELGYGVALANKKIFAEPLASAQPYFSHPQVRHESTVGGGQPVIATLRYLLDVSDPIFEIEGQMSGTLGYICAELDKGVPFSAAVREAKARGYTEPDPRDDLSGADVMRKVMILGRMAGWPLEVADIEVESLYPEEMAGLSVADFLEQLPKLDEAMGERVKTAVSQNNVIRYMAVVNESGGRVGLLPMSADSGLSNLKYISFKTERYSDDPLLIGGKGAGVEMTAAGVIGDMVSLVRELF